MAAAATSGQSHRRTAAIAVAAIVVVGACGGGSKKSARPAASSSPGAGSSTTPTTATPPPIAPLTGLAQPDAAKLHRPALVVKIDNVDQARPQAGIGQADLVFEEMVEGRLTRLIAVFQSTDADLVGPVRSTRTTDIDIVSALNHPLYAYSGGNTGFVAQLRAAPVTDIGYEIHIGAYFRTGVGEHTLFGRMAALYGLAPAGAQPPPPLFQYRPAVQVPAGGGPGSHVDVPFGDAFAIWDWDPPSQTYKRGQNGTADIDKAGQQLAAANVIVQFLTYVTDGIATGEGPPAPIPKGQSVGTGTATILSGGVSIPATWSKATPTAITQYADASGHPILLAPGRTWVELAPVGNATHVR